MPVPAPSRRRPRPPPPWPLAALALLVASCAGEASRVTIAHAPGYAETPHARMSVLGVFRDGQMSPESWAEMTTLLPAEFQPPGCNAAFGPQPAIDAATAAAIADTARDNGVADEWLDLVAGLAEGDGVLVFVVSGRVAAPPKEAAPGAPAPGAAPGRGRGGRGRPPPAPDRPRDPGLEMTALVFSARLHRTVAAVTLKYTGHSDDEARRRFGEAFASGLPGVGCGGWREGASLDLGRLRRVGEP